MPGLLVDCIKHVLASGYIFLKTAELKCVIRWMECISVCKGESFSILVNILTGFISVYHKYCPAGLQAQIYFLVSDFKWNVLVWHYILLIHD